MSVVWDAMQGKVGRTRSDAAAAGSLVTCWNSAHNSHRFLYDKSDGSFFDAHRHTASMQIAWRKFGFLSTTSFYIRSDLYPSVMKYREV